jgi:uncharacterized damage-inducible protein DinB
MKTDLGPYALLPDFLEFTIWGDQTILQAALAVAEDEYYKERGISAGSLHKLLVHAMGSQWVWLSRFKGIPWQMPDATSYPTRAALAQRWPEVHETLREFVGNLSLAALESPITFQTMRGDLLTYKLGQLLLHVTDHGTYHRGQQNTLIKMSGGTPVNVFYYQWAMKRGL